MSLGLDEDIERWTARRKAAVDPSQPPMQLATQSKGISGRIHEQNAHFPDESLARHQSAMRERFASVLLGTIQKHVQPLALLGGAPIIDGHTRSQPPASTRAGREHVAHGNIQQGSRNTTVQTTTGIQMIRPHQ